MVLRTWWPLAASWALMALELPAISAAMARLPQPAINLAAWGGVVFPVALIVEAPVIMLLAASTALSRDRATYRRIRGYMLWMGAGLTALHVLLAFTPLFDLVVVTAIGPPPEIVEAARLGLRLMTPWTWSIAFRRFNQGVLIRFGHSRAVGVGTLIRLTADSTVLLAGLAIGSAPGIVVAGCAVSTGVIAEAVYSAFRLKPVLAAQVPEASATGEVIDRRSFAAFYIPLALTSLLTMLTIPLGSAVVSRLPHPLDSLAAWPALAGLVFLFRSVAMAYNEVVVARLDIAGSYRSLRAFTGQLTAAVTVGLFLIAATPLSVLWFQGASGLPADLAQLGRSALGVAIPLPGLTALQSWFQGALVQSRRTRAVTESIVLNLATLAILFPAAVALASDPRGPARDFPGLHVAWAGFSTGSAVQVAWLWWRSRGALAHARDLAIGAAAPVSLGRMPGDAAEVPTPGVGMGGPAT
jgi:hypothetical protein